MSDDNVVVTKNQDGTIKIAGGEITGDFVPKVDLVNVKTASEAAKDEFDKSTTKHQTDMAEANRVKDETHQSLLQSQARIEQLEKDNKELPTLQTKVGELETSLTAADEGRRTAETSLLGLKREAFVVRYKADPEKVKEMTLDQLTEAEKSYALVGFNANLTQKPANYDGGTGGGGVTTPKTQIEQARSELDLAKKMQAAKRSGDPTYDPNKE